jgi:hypothetical protein
VTRGEKLAHAELLIRDVLESLSTASSTCASCGHRRYDDHNEFKAAATLAGVAERLNRLKSQKWAKKE